MARDNYFKVIRKTILTAISDNIDMDNLKPYKHFMLVAYLLPSGNITPGIRFNGDTGNNYSRRRSENGAGDTTATAANHISLSSIASANINRIVAFIHNDPSIETPVSAWLVEMGTAGAANAPNRSETLGKWVTLTNVTRITVFNNGAGDFAAGSEAILMAVE